MSKFFNIIKFLKPKTKVYRGTNSSGGVGEAFVSKDSKLKGKFATFDKDRAIDYASKGSGFAKVKKYKLNDREIKTGKKLTRTKQGVGEEFILPKKTMKKGKIDLSGTIQANIKKIIKEGI